jgi:hypothetical protein
MKSVVKPSGLGEFLDGKDATIELISSSKKGTSRHDRSSGLEEVCLSQKPFVGGLPLPKVLKNMTNHLSLAYY